MSSAVTIVDYGSGNLLSVARALEHCGASVELASDAQRIAAARRVVLPGVGAFADAMEGLRSRGLVEPLRRYARSGRPMLGICLGMQMLASASEEFGLSEGLDLIAGRVVAIPRTTVQGRPHKIPHIGWNDLLPPEGAAWDRTILADTPPGTAMYLVHSFHFVPTDASDAIAVCRYGGHAITAAVQRGNIVGCQFHPEKSANSGLRLLSRFMRL